MRALSTLLLTTLAWAHPPEGAVPEDQGHVVEVSFGSAQLFIKQPLRGEPDAPDTAVIPVASAMMLVEWLAQPRLGVASLFNLPLQADRRFVDGVLKEQFAAPTLAIGLRWTAVSLPVFRAARLGLQGAVLAGTTIGSREEDRLFPLLAGRTHIRTHNGASVYLGASWAFAKDTLAVLYGVGHRF